MTVFDETLQPPPAGFEFGLPLSLSSIGTVRGPAPGQLAKPEPLVQTVPQFSDFDIFLDISKGTIVLKGCSVTAFCQGCSPPNMSLLDFEPIPNISPKQQSFHSFDDAVDCGSPTASIDGYASLKVDLSMSPFLGNQITLISLFGYSFQARVPIAAPPTGTMNLIVWGPGGVGSDWLNGAGSLFAASVLPSANQTLTPHTFTPNVDLTSLLAFFVETASHAVESFPDNQDAYNAPVTLRLRVSEILDVIVNTDVPPFVIAGAIVNILGKTGVIVATGTTDSFGVATFSLAPDNYFAQSVLGSHTQTSPLLSPMSQTVRFSWPGPKPSVTYTDIAGIGVTFDASNSTDPAGPIANDTFSWVFGDGTSQAGVGLINVSHAYAPGMYTVMLTMTSTDGLSATISFTINVVVARGGGRGFFLQV